MPRLPFLSSTVKGLTSGLNASLKAMGRADSAEIKEAAKILKRSFRTVLGQRGGGRPSAPGDAPRKQSGQLARSVRDGVVGDVRRVAVTQYTAPILEAGINSALPLRSTKVRRRRANRARRVLVIAPRPFRQRAIDAVANEMADRFAELGVKRLEGLAG